MIKFLCSFTFCFLFIASFSQDSSQTNINIGHYNSGVSALKNDAYAKADSFFTLAVNAGEKTKDIYYNRAIARRKLGNTCGYSVDMACAAAKGDKEANTAFWKKCRGTNMALTCTQNIRVTLRDTQAIIAEYDTVKNITNIRILELSKEAAFGCFVDGINSQDTSYPETITYESAGFVGGDAALFKFLQQNTNYPHSERDNGIQGKVFISYTIDTDGSITDVQLYRRMKDGPGMEQEALRVVKLMPKWIPGKLNGKVVKIKYILPYHFRLG